MQPAMPTEPEMGNDIAALCDNIEDCYEFTLSYAARGLASDEDSEAGNELRGKLTAALKAIGRLEVACKTAVRELDPARAGKCEAFVEVLSRDAQSSSAIVEMVLAQPAISSQLIDNLNASIHLRALLTDLFLITEIVAVPQANAGQEP
jgi:hypothetical protein